MASAFHWAEVARQVQQHLQRGETEAAFRLIDQQAASPDSGAQGPNPGFRETAQILYWKLRDLPAYVAVLREHLGRLEAMLPHTEEPSERAAILCSLGGTHYNLASFTWPGWSEAGIRITDAEVEIGRSSAHQCLEIRRDPEHTDVQFGYTLAMAHWVVGAFHLHDQEWNAAREQFALAHELALAAGETGWLEAGYGALTNFLAAPEDPEAQEHFRAVLADLEARPDDENAVFVRDQLVTCRDVYGGRSG